MYHEDGLFQMFILTRTSLWEARGQLSFAGSLQGWLLAVFSLSTFSS